MSGTLLILICIFFSYEHKKNNSISSYCSNRSFFGFSNDGLHSANNSLDKQVIYTFY